MMTKHECWAIFDLHGWQDTCVGYRKACAQIRSSRVRRHCENCPRLRLGWKRGTLFHARRAGILWITSRGFVGCIRSSASIEFRRSRAHTESWMVRHEETSQSTRTRRRDQLSTSTSKRTRRLRSGCVPDRALERPDTSKFVGCGSQTPFVTRSCA